MFEEEKFCCKIIQFFGSNIVAKFDFKQLCCACIEKQYYKSNTYIFNDSSFLLFWEKKSKKYKKWARPTFFDGRSRLTEQSHYHHGEVLITTRLPNYTWKNYFIISYHSQTQNQLMQLGWWTAARTYTCKRCNRPSINRTRNRKWLKS